MKRPTDITKTPAGPTKQGHSTAAAKTMQLLALATPYAGECVFSQSFSAVSMRVCQPAPVALKAAMTSGDSRMVVDTLVGVFCGPRELMPSVFCNSSGNTSAAGLNLRISAVVSSRTSPSASISGARGFIVSYLSGVGLAKADDTDATSHWGKAQHVQSGVQKTQRHIANFGVSLAGVLPDQCRAKVELCHTVKAQGAFTDVALVLGRVIFDVHPLIVVTGLAACPPLARRGTIHTKAKAPALENVLGIAVCTPTDKRGLVMPEISRHGFAHVGAVGGHGRGYPQGHPHGYSHVFNCHAHPLRVKTQPVASKSRIGATMPRPPSGQP